MVSDDRPTAAPARFPYREHRTLAEVAADERRVDEAWRAFVERERRARLF